MIQIWILNIFKNERIMPTMDTKIFVKYKRMMMQNMDNKYFQEGEYYVNYR